MKPKVEPRQKRKWSPRCSESLFQPPEEVPKTIHFGRVHKKSLWVHAWEDLLPFQKSEGSLEEAHPPAKVAAPGSQKGSHKAPLEFPKNLESRARAGTKTKVETDERGEAKKHHLKLLWGHALKV